MRELVAIDHVGFDGLPLSSHQPTPKRTMALVRAAGFVIFQKVKDTYLFLLLQASYEPYHWTPPKGHTEANEDDVTTAFRETQEEAGLTIEQLKILDKKKTINYMVKDVPKAVTYILAELTDPSAKVVLSHEHQAYKWVEYEEAVTLVSFPDLQDLFQEFYEYLTDE